MRFLANENVADAIVLALRASGHDVAWIRTDSPGVADEFVLARANAEARTLITFDKDFGQLAFARGHAFHCGVILFRLAGMSATALARLVSAVVNSRDDWVGKFSVVDRHGVRMVHAAETTDEQTE